MTDIMITVACFGAAAIGLAYIYWDDLMYGRPRKVKTKGPFR